jgi:hypothetical protein
VGDRLGAAVGGISGGAVGNALGTSVGALVPSVSHHARLGFTEQSVHAGAVGVAAHVSHQGGVGVALQSMQNGSCGYVEQSSHPGCEASVRQMLMHQGRKGITEQSTPVGSITSLVGIRVGGVGALVGGKPVHCGVSRARSASLVTACPCHVEQ